jgi:DNA-binding transcriptional LysR family regulator
VELRDIEIFLTLAEELHFGRTAERLHVSQARVSQAIKQQERRIGAPLFERTSRKVALTPIGEQLRADLAIGYQRITDAVEAATAAAHGHQGQLVLGVTGPLAQEISPVTDVFRARHPDCELLVREVVFSDPFGPLRRGEVDLALIWFPVHERDLTLGPVMVIDPVVIAVAAWHPLAAQGRVCMEDLGDYPVMQSTLPIPAYWEEALQPRTTPSGRPIVRGPSVATWEEVMTSVTTGEAVSFAGSQAIRYHSRPDIAYLPIEDGHTLQWGLIWRSDTDRPLVRAFADIARTQEPVDLSYLTERSS